MIVCELNYKAKNLREDHKILIVAGWHAGWNKL